MLSYPNARKDCVACHERDAAVVFSEVTTPPSGAVPSETLRNPPLAPGMRRLRRPVPREKLLCVPCFSVQLLYWMRFIFDLGRLTTTVVLTRPVPAVDVSSAKPPYGDCPKTSGDCPLCGQDTDGFLVGVDSDDFGDRPAVCGECLAWIMSCHLWSHPQPGVRMTFRVRLKPS
ncbi:hypothetical protein [Kibdelosporangium aridum]|uniref:hypothetical protein n=1 Tax=Kibdelosporangium aridum TaxID=2030 RepID=UPI0035E5BA38